VRADVEIDVNCVFEGSVSLGEGVRIGANCVIANARIAAGAVIHPFTHIDGEKAGVTVGEGRWSGRSRGCARVRNWGPRCTSATSSR
jgi:bifunctional UDP-N-acetylglucosamine pyrophosphorylase/glucosamine-1-phosphate N-acetyltransferase